MEIYDNRSQSQTPDHAHTPRTNPSATTHTIAAPQRTDAGYWRFCSIVLGIGFLIAIAGHAGPSSASASSNNTGYTGFPHTDLESTHPIYEEAVLSVGGFETVDGELMFVMVNQTGHRIGLMQMPDSNESQ